MKKIMVFIFAVITMGFGGAIHAEDSNLRAMMTAPLDTAEAQRVRIWVPVEHSSTCRVSVAIVDTAGSQVRHVLDRPLAPAYYNLYWDKKDDTGAYVGPGTYTAVISDICADERRDKLEVVYMPGELSGKVNTPGERVPDSLSFEILVDSAGVSCDILNRQDRIQAHIMTDSVFLKGSHVYTWPEKLTITPGLYTARITIDGYTRLCPIRHIRKN